MYSSERVRDIQRDSVQNETGQHRLFDSSSNVHIIVLWLASDKVEQLRDDDDGSFIKKKLDIYILAGQQPTIYTAFSTIYTSDKDRKKIKKNKKFEHHETQTATR